MPSDKSPWPTLTHEALYGALRVAVVATIDHSASPQAQAYYRDSGAERWSEEFRTVRFGVGRRMGHTTMAFRLAMELAPERALILFQNRDTADIHRYQPEVQQGLVRTGTINSLHRAFRGQETSLVIVDIASKLPQSKLLEIYAEAKSHNPIFVLLG